MKNIPSAEKTRNIIIRQEFEDITKQEPNIQDNDTLANKDISNTDKRKKFNLPRFEDAKQKQAFLNIIRFTAIVLVFTIIARGTAGATMAKVELITPVAGEIIEAVNTDGKVEAVGTFSPDVPANIIIEEILVVPGQNVRKGDVLALLNIADIEEQRRRAEIQLENMELNLAKLERGEAYNSSTLLLAQTAYNWAAEDVNAAQANGKDSVNEANSQMNNAKQASADAEAEYNSVLADENAGEEQREAAKQALENMKTRVSEGEKAVTAAERAAGSGNDAAARALENARQSLEAAKREDGRERQAAADTQAQNAVDAQNLRLDIEKEKEYIAVFDTIGIDGKLLSAVDGTVLEIGQAGALSGENGVVKVSDASRGFRVTSSITQEQAKAITSGANAEISMESGYFENDKLGKATLISLSDPDTNNMVTAIFSLPEREWKQGENVNLNIVQSKKDYRFCVPVSALHQNQNGYYVLVVNEISGVLGTENIVRIFPVQVLANNGNIAAIEGAVSSSNRIVDASSKPLANGDKVRVAQP